jgi:hypothetical protein
MSSPASSSRQPGPAVWRASWPDSQLRVGDAERMAIADRLAKHFSEGRLDEAEFSARLDRAMRATTMADLTGLLSDLPDTEPVQPTSAAAAASRRQQRKMLRLQLERERLRLAHERRQQRQTARRTHARSVRWLLLLVGGMILLIVAAHALMHSIGAWLILGLIAFLWLRRGNSGYRGD